MRTILVVLYVFFFLLFSLPVLGIEWIVSRFDRQRADIHTLRMVQWGFRCVMFISGVKLTINGIENVPKDEAVLYIGNHRSIFDIVTTYSLCPSPTGYIAKNGVNKVPVLGLVMKRIYCLFLDRNDIKQGMKTILTAIDYVNNGVSICIFPEGTRNKENSDLTSLLPFKEGSFKIAQKTGCRIIPMAITGTADIFENHFPWIHKGSVTVTYGKPIDLSELDKAIQKKPGSYCQQIVSDMLARTVQ